MKNLLWSAERVAIKSTGGEIDDQIAIHLSIETEVEVSNDFADCESRFGPLSPRSPGPPHGCPAGFKCLAAGSRRALTAF
jgi:hypothetical protein